MKRFLYLLPAMALVLTLPTAMSMADDEDKETKQEEKREKIDEMADDTLKRLFSESPGSKSLYAEAAGYAVFGVTKAAFGISGGGGSGVAVDKDGNSRTYMKMGTGGIGLGIGAQSFQVVFLFEKDQTFANFIDGKWDAGAAASAAAGTDGANAATTFTNGIAIYQMTEKGLIANADISGTKYWVNKKLN